MSQRPQAARCKVHLTALLSGLFALLSQAAAGVQNTLTASDSALIDGSDQFTGNRLLAVVVTADDFAPEDAVTFEGFDRGLMFVCNTADPSSEDVGVWFKPGLIYQNEFPAATVEKQAHSAPPSSAQDGGSPDGTNLISDAQRHALAWEQLRLLAVKIRFGFDRTSREVVAQWDDTVAGAAISGKPASSLLRDAWRNETLVVTVGDAKPMRFELEQARDNLLSFKRKCDAS